MKKLLLLAILAVTFSTAAFAVENRLMGYSAVTSTSGGATITANMTAVSNRKIVIYNVIGRSDLSTSIIQIQEANTSGVTGNYTTVMRLDVGAATRQYNNYGGPIFVGKIGYAYRLLLNCTTANSLISLYAAE